MAGNDFAPRWSWREIEAVILKISLSRFTASLRMGASDEDSALMARAQIADDIRRGLIQQNEQEHS